jgi:hypothetical protein
MEVIERPPHRRPHATKALAYDRDGGPHDNDDVGDLVDIEGPTDVEGHRTKASRRKTRVKAR